MNVPVQRSSDDRMTERSRSEQHEEGIMIGDWKTKLQAVLCAAMMTAGIGAVSAPQAVLAAPNMVDYTNYPMFLNKTGPVNILFLVDFSNYTLEAAFTGSNHKYPISFKSGTPTDSKYAANVTIDSNAGADLVAVDSNGVAISSATDRILFRCSSR